MAKNAMVPLTPDELEALRQMINDDRLSDAEKDDLIRTVDHIVQSFILQARGLDGVQLSLSARANAAFQLPENRDSLQEYDTKERVDLGHSIECVGVIENKSPNNNPEIRPREA
jgi:hypothetical protein